MLLGDPTDPTGESQVGESQERGERRQSINFRENTHSRPFGPPQAVRHVYRTAMRDGAQQQQQTQQTKIVAGRELQERLHSRVVLSFLFLWYEVRRTKNMMTSCTGAKKYYYIVTRGDTFYLKPIAVRDRCAPQHQRADCLLVTIPLVGYHTSHLPYRSSYD